MVSGTGRKICGAAVVCHGIELVTISVCVGCIENDRLVAGGVVPSVAHDGTEIIHCRSMDIVAVEIPVVSELRLEVASHHKGIERLGMTEFLGILSVDRRGGHESTVLSNCRISIHIPVGLAGSLIHSSPVVEGYEELRGESPGQSIQVLPEAEVSEKGPEHIPDMSLVHKKGHRIVLTVNLVSSVYAVRIPYRECG